MASLNAVACGLMFFEKARWNFASNGFAGPSILIFVNNIPVEVLFRLIRLDCTPYAS